MILTSTLNAELDRIDREIAALNRKRFACLSRCDFAGAKRFYEQILQLGRERGALVNGELPLTADE